MRKLILSLMAVFMTLSLACGSAFLVVGLLDNSYQEVQEKEDAQTGVTASGNWIDQVSISSNANGYLTIEDGYIQIWDELDLAEFMYCVNHGKKFNNGKLVADYSVKLRKHLDMSAHYWTPIGTQYNVEGYKGGAYDPNGGTFGGESDIISISGITITNRNNCAYGYTNGIQSPPYLYGLFGMVNNVTIQNIQLFNINIAIDFSERIDYVVKMGGLAGDATNVKVKNVLVYGNVGYKYVGSSWGTNLSDIGGIVGQMDSGSQIFDSINHATVSVNVKAGNEQDETRYYIGGILGADDNRSTDKYWLGEGIKNCLNYGKVSFENPAADHKSNYLNGFVVGGIVGYSESHILNNYNFGEIFVQGWMRTRSDWHAAVGGIAGESNYIIEECFNMSTTRMYICNASCVVGGIVGLNNYTVKKSSNFTNIDVRNGGEYAACAYGGIAGKSYGHSNASGTWLASHIFDCVNFGKIYCKTYNNCEMSKIGGIVGFVYGRRSEIEQCLNYGKLEITCNSNRVGGLVGLMGTKGDVGTVIRSSANFANIKVANFDRVGEVVGAVYINGTTLSNIGNNIINAFGTELSTISLVGCAYDSKGNNLGNYDYMAANLRNTYAKMFSRVGGILRSKDFGQGADWIDCNLLENYLGESAVKDYVVGWGSGQQIIMPAYLFAKYNMTMFVLQNGKYFDGSVFSEAQEARKYLHYNRKDNNASGNLTTGEVYFIKGLNWKSSMSMRINNIYGLKIAIEDDSGDISSSTSSFQLRSFSDRNITVTVDCEKTLSPTIKYYFHNGTKETYLSSSTARSYGRISNISKSVYVGKNFSYTINIEPGYYVKSFSAENVSRGYTTLESGVYRTGDSYESEYWGYQVFKVVFAEAEFTINVTVKSYEGSLSSSNWKNQKLIGNSLSLGLQFGPGDKGSKLMKEGLKYCLKLGEIELDYTYNVEKYEYALSGLASKLIGKQNIYNTIIDDKRTINLDLVEVETFLKINVAGASNSIEALETYKENTAAGSTTFSITALDNFSSPSGTIPSDVLLIPMLDKGATSVDWGSAYGYIPKETICFEPIGIWGNITEDKKFSVSSKNIGQQLLKEFKTYKGVSLEGLTAFMEKYTYSSDESYNDQKSVETINLYSYYDLGQYELYLDEVDGDSASYTVESTAAVEKGKDFYKIYYNSSVKISTTSSDVEGYYVGTLDYSDGDKGNSLAGLGLCFVTYKNEYVFKLETTNEKNIVKVQPNFVAFETGGTAVSPDRYNGNYYISSAENLIWLARQVASGESFKGKNFVQTANINLEGKNFKPIGDYGTPFKGHYNGQGFVINGLATPRNDGLTSAGLFGYAEGSTIKNLSINGCELTGWANVGAFVGNAKKCTFENLNVCGLEVTATDFYLRDIFGNAATNLRTNILTETEKEAALSRAYFGGVVGYAENCSFVKCSSRGVVLNGASAYGNITYRGALVGWGKTGTCSFKLCYAEAVSQKVKQTAAGEAGKNCHLVSNYLTHSVLDCYSQTKIGTSQTYVFYNPTNSANVSIATFAKSNATEAKEEVANLSSDIWFVLNNKPALKAFYWC